MSIGSGTLYNLLARVAFLVSGYALQFSLARWLTSPADYGRLGLLLSLVTLARTVLSTGLPQAITQFVAADPSAAESIHRRGAALQMAGAAGVWLAFVALTPGLARFLGDPELVSLLLLISPLIPLMAYHQANLGYVSGKLWFGRQALLTLAYSVARYAGAAAFVLLGFGLEGALWGLLSATAAVALLSRASIPRAHAPSPVGVRQLLGFSWPLVIFSFGVSALLNLDLLLLGRYFPGQDEVGFYSGAVNLGKAPYFVFYAFSTTLLPSLARLHAVGDLEGLRSALSRQLRFLMLGALPCAGLLGVSSGPVLAFVYGSPYAAAAGALGLLAFSTAALSVLVVLASALTACGRPRTSMLLMLACLPLQAALGTWLIPAAGMTGAALSNLLVTLCGAFAAWVLVRRVIGPVWELRALASAAASTVLAALAMLALPPTSGIGVLVSLGFGFACYALLTGVTGGFTPAELEQISSKLRRRARPNES